jgi:hypothetical protein
VQRYSIDYASPASQVRFSRSGEIHHAVLDFAISAFDDNGGVLARSALQTISDMKPATYADAAVGGLRMHQQADVPLGATSLRLGVQDELGRHLGTVELPLPLKGPPDEPTTRARSFPPVEPE